MRIKFLFLVLCIISFDSFSQNAVMSFDTTTYDFGKINEDGGNAIHTFFFSNTGTDTLSLSNVKASCGCTTADWSKGPVLPGQMGYIKAEYHPKNRVGIFNKSITVTSNAKVPTQVLIIKGEVLARKRDYKDTFIVQSGNLRMKSNHIAFMEIKNNQVKTDTLDILNDWGKTMTLKATSKLSFATYKVIPEILKPNEKGMIILTYDASAKKDWGLVYDYIYLETNDTLETQKIITISANIVEDFSALTEKQKLKAPKVTFDTLTYDFGSVKEGDTVKYSFIFVNKGKSDLVIRKIKSSCGCTAVEMVDGSSNQKMNSGTKEDASGSYIFKKGKGGKIEVAFNTTGRKGDQSKTITVITNDPERSVITLNIKGKVSDK
jgi:hypothetical protein